MEEKRDSITNLERQVCGRGYLPSKEGVTKDNTELHYGKCFLPA